MKSFNLKLRAINHFDCECGRVCRASCEAQSIDSALSPEDNDRPNMVLPVLCIIRNNEPFKRPENLSPCPRRSREKSEF